MQRLIEHVTFCGMPCDLDVAPDVDFVGQDNAALLNIAVDLLGDAQGIVSGLETQASIAKTVKLGAQHGENTLQAAGKRADHAKSSLRTAMSGTDVARGRVRNLEQKVSELQKVISDEQEANSGPFAQTMQIVELGVAVGQVVAGVSTGVGAIAAVGRGFATLQQTASAATSTDVGGIDFAGVTKVEVEFHTQALSRSGFAARATEVRRLLRPLPGWPVRRGASRGSLLRARRA